MFCQKCGAELPDNAAFCPICGGQRDSREATPEPSKFVEARLLEEKHSMQAQILKYGILALAFASTLGILLVGGILGVVFGNKALSLYREYARMYPDSGSVRVGFGHGLGKAGKILGTVMIPLSIIYWLLVIVLLAIGVLTSISVLSLI